MNKEYIINFIDELKELGLTIKKSVIIKNKMLVRCISPNNNEIVINNIGDTWNYTINNSNTINCYYTKDDLIESLKSYLRV